MADDETSGSRALIVQRQPSPCDWQEAFLSELAATSNITASAKRAGVSTSRAYDAKRRDPAFYRKWQQALIEGYDHLEMDLLHRLRTGEIKPPSGAKKGVRTYDNATAFRLLSTHREAVARERAIRDDEDAEAVLASIDAKLDRMRERALKAAEAANEA